MKPCVCGGVKGTAELQPNMVCSATQERASKVAHISDQVPKFKDGIAFLLIVAAKARPLGLKVMGSPREPLLKWSPVEVSCYS